MEDTVEIARASVTTPVVIGLYGLPGSGKTTLMHRLQQDLPGGSFLFYEGSEVIASLVQGGIDAFRDLALSEQVALRQRAIEQIKQQCIDEGRTGIVTGHFMLWSDEKGSPTSIHTGADLSTFSHIIYIDATAEEIVERCVGDGSRSRQIQSHAVIEEWARKEKSGLRYLCSRNEILFYTLPGAATVRKVVELCLDFARHSPGCNLECATHALDALFDWHESPVGAAQTMLVFDADKTLAPFDTGKMLHDAVVRKLGNVDAEFLKTLFGGPLGYSYLAFRQLVLTYDEAMTDSTFEELCSEVASAVQIYPEIMFLLKRATTTPRMKALVVTSGFKKIWEKVLELAEHGCSVQVIGGGRLCDSYVVDAEVKAQLVSRLRTTYHQYVWVFGDSPLDVAMMQEADQAIVIVGEEGSRSRSMDGALAQALKTTPMRARQALVPGTVRPRLDLARLPPCYLESEDFIRELVSPRLELYDESESAAAKLLMTATRDAEKSGPLLRKAHERIGRFLAAHVLTEVIGLEEYPIKHVQGGLTIGHRLKEEARTLVVAMMQGGEPLAMGVSATFPESAFLHARNSNDIKHTHLNGCVNVILCDSVVNNGSTMKDAIEHVRALRSDVSIAALACVVQRRSVGNEGLLREAAIRYGVKIITLRVSDNRYTGQGNTDTGNRLFNTTFLQ
jgi:uracil phosphoribosyltransferase/adenylate kinase/phosphoserine phosphatase